MPGRTWGIRIKNFHHPDKQLIRQDWHKHNLYSLFQRTKLPDQSRNTIFQQSWAAKRDLRAYHFPYVTINQFLSRHWPKSGLPLQEMTRAERERVPPMQSLMFAELERRLETVVFRCNFAPSIMRAREMVSKGHVRVNGEKVKAPNRRLEDGDMITIKPSALPYRKKGEDGPIFEADKWSAPWMFVPDYLEVDYQTASAVFLRSPLPQPDKVEIPSPYPPSIHQLGFAWYSRIIQKKKQMKSPLRAPRNPYLNIGGQAVRLKKKFYSLRLMDNKNREKALYSAFVEKQQEKKERAEAAERKKAETAPA
ncbi:mitochondrial 37S ribosomal protein nam9 [Rhizophlyctis rosea]|uniref:Mitochondrial 37S ribosomal protein nam9 n=1 Tax=Rhizophlyctis rosea TaxID=64517 RepID=A0AAD5SNK8_9FUNG|nr:mitochondrial 37S ribosomal protein nam9 [Rhizophlyctis rosea]